MVVFNLLIGLYFIIYILKKKNRSLFLLPAPTPVNFYLLIIKLRFKNTWNLRLISSAHNEESLRNAKRRIRFAIAKVFIRIFAEFSLIAKWNTRTLNETIWQVHQRSLWSNITPLVISLSQMHEAVVNFLLGPPMPLSYEMNEPQKKKL